VRRERVGIGGGTTAVEVEERRARLLLRVVGPDEGEEEEEGADEVTSARLRLRVSIQRLNPPIKTAAHGGGSNDPRSAMPCHRLQTLIRKFDRKNRNFSPCTNSKIAKPPKNNNKP